MKGRFWTLVTHMFLHIDYSHLSNNMIQLAVCGWKCFNAFSSNGFLIVYFGGGIIAAAEERLNTFQYYSRIMSYVPKVPSSGGVLENIGAIINQNVESLAWQVAKAAEPLTPCIGASNGVYSMLGVDLCLTLENAVYALKKLLRHKHVENEVMFSILMGVSSLNKIMCTITQEGRSLLDGSSGNVGHAGHLVGFCTGLVFYGSFRLTQWARKKQKGNARTRR